MRTSPKVLLATCGSWWLPHTAKAFEARNALSALWISDANRTGLSTKHYKRCWPFHVAMKPFYHWAPQIVRERAFYALFPLWRDWVLRTDVPQECNVVQGIVGYCTELFRDYRSPRRLRVVDCPNSHPLTYYGFWQRECDLWCPNHKVPIPRWMFARMTRELEDADLVIVPSLFCKESMLLNGIPERKILVAGMGVDTSVFSPRTSPPKDIRFVAVGTICLRKGHQYLFRAFEQVKRIIPSAELVCVGAYKADFAREKLRWKGTFTHISHLDQPRLATMLQTCTAFVLASQEEGLPRAQVEAMAVGLPVIATHEGGATTVVDHGVEGFIVPARDPSAIAEAMIKLASQPQLGELMGKAALLRASQLYNWQAYGDRLLEHYDSALNSC